MAATGFEAHGGLILFSHALYSGVVRPANIACNIYVICCHQGLVAGHHFVFAASGRVYISHIPFWQGGGGVVICHPLSSGIPATCLS